MYTDEFRAAERGPWPGPMTGRRAGRSFVYQGPVPASEDVRRRAAVVTWRDVAFVE